MLPSATVMHSWTLGPVQSSPVQSSLVLFDCLIWGSGLKFPLPSSAKIARKMHFRPASCCRVPQWCGFFILGLVQSSPVWFVWYDCSIWGSGLNGRLSCPHGGQNCKKNAFQMGSAILAEWHNNSFCPYFVSYTGFGFTVLVIKSQSTFEWQPIKK